MTPTLTLDSAHRNRLIALARQSIELGLGGAAQAAMPEQSLPTPLHEPRGSFVTLRIGKQLRGCCGNLRATRSLADDVWRNAWASAFADPRFSPLEDEEWPDVHLHISVLSPLESMAIKDEVELLATLRPGIDGLLLERDLSRATFLPDVWSDVPEPAEFVRHLKQKAGWPGDAWSPQIRVWRYTTESFGEPSASEAPLVRARAR
jgi:uncharacterized protein